MTAMQYAEKLIADKEQGITIFDDEQRNLIVNFAFKLDDWAATEELVNGLAAALAEDDKEEANRLMYDAQEKIENLPDGMIGFSEMHDYGYRKDDVLPLTKEGAREWHRLGERIYPLFRDGTAGDYASQEEIEQHDGIFGIKADAWDAILLEQREDYAEDEYARPDFPLTVMLNDENVPVPSVYNKENKAYGKETTYTIAPVILWDSSRVWKILTAYVYTGAMVLGKTKTLISGKSIVRTVPKGQQFITEGTHEAIVSREEFEKAQLVIKSNSHKVLMGGVDFPLKGKVRCGNCRRVMAHNFKQVVPTFWCREGLELVGQTQCTSEIFQVSDIESAVFQALKKELSLLDSLYGDMQKEELALKEAHKKANRRKTLMEQELKNLKGEKMRMYEEYAAGTLPLDTYKQKKQECDRRISEVQEQIEQSKAEESAESVVPGTVRAAAEQAENFLHGTRLTAGMVSAFIENVFVHDGGRIVVRFKYEQSIQDTVKALHTD